MGLVQFSLDVEKQMYGKCRQVFNSLNEVTFGLIKIFQLLEPGINFKLHEISKSMHIRKSIFFFLKLIKII
jgi:hypothetical protein